MSGLWFGRARSVLAAILIASATVSPPVDVAVAATQTGPRRDVEAPRPDRMTPADLDRWIDEASRRFDVPAAWIHAVIAVESAYGGHPASATLVLPPYSAIIVSRA